MVCMPRTLIFLKYSSKLSLILKNIFTQIFFIGQEKKRRAIPQFSVKETLYSDINIFPKHWNKFVYIPIILCWQHNPLLISRPRFYLHIVYIRFSCWHKQTCSLPHILAKLQNTPQLIYMCREALKIEA